MYNRFCIFILLIFLISCSRDIFKYPNPNFLRYQPESSTLPISDPAIFVGREPVRLSDLKGKDFKNKNAQSYFKNMPPNIRSRQNQQVYQDNRVFANPKRGAAQQSSRSRPPMVNNNVKGYDYQQVEQYYQNTPYPYQIKRDQEFSAPLVRNSPNSKYDNQGFNQVLKKDPIENYPEITAQYPYKDQYKKSKQNNNPYVLNQEDREALGLMSENYFAPKSNTENSGYRFKSTNIEEIEVIEELDSDILDNMINNDALNQRFKTRSLPSY